MTANTMALLDQEELMKLALAASAENDSGTAIGYLKEATSRPDAVAVAHYLLGAEYAQIQMYERAIAEMERALELNPALPVVRLQLGMLWLTNGVGDKALTVLQPLQELDSDNEFHQFGAGLCHLIKDEFADATAKLQAGIAKNGSNPALNRDMEKILQEIDKLRAEGKLAPEAEKNADEESQHILLSAYTSTTTH